MFAPSPGYSSFRAGIMSDLSLDHQCPAQSLMPRGHLTEVYLRNRDSKASLVQFWRGGMCPSHYYKKIVMRVSGKYRGIRKSGKD